MYIPSKTEIADYVNNPGFEASVKNHVENMLDTLPEPEYRAALEKTEL